MDDLLTIKAELPLTALSSSIVAKTPKKDDPDTT